jgi:hypothetical protein
MRRHEVIPGGRSPQGGQVDGRVEVAGHDHPPHRGQGIADLAQRSHPIESSAPVDVSFGRQQDRRFDLAEPVEHAGRPEIRRGGAEGGPQRHGAQHEDHRLRHVRHPRGHAVAGADPLGPEGSRHRRHLRAQLVPGERAGGAVLAGGHDGGIGPGPASPIEQVLDHAEPGVGEEPGLRHRRSLGDHPLAPVADHSGVVPDRRPELVGSFHGPAVELLEPGHRPAGSNLGEATEVCEPGPCDPFGRRGPQRRPGHPGRLPPLGRTAGR